PFTSDEKSRLESALSGMPVEKFSWLSAFLAGAGQGAAATATVAAALKVHIFYGSESGNAEGLAYDAKKILAARGCT
ncbi:flavodoxin-like domain-containing protein, partial [Escherichia coli]|uniref:flavodoxin-like domain-containing protein n=1 Tax=Escherichia coli TaxID=562 RepID=UPI001BE3CFF2